MTGGRAAGWEPRRTPRWAFIDIGDTLASVRVDPDRGHDRPFRCASTPSPRCRRPADGGHFKPREHPGDQVEEALVSCAGFSFSMW